jgi:hypothetical protein
VERYAALLALVVLVAVLIERIGRRWLRSRKARRRGARAVRGEHDAETLLEELGFTVLDRQVPLVWTISVGDEDHEIELRADLVVEQDELRYVAEVKTGSAAPRVDNAATRRQLLEYRVAYDVDGVLLVDVDAGSVVEVEFPLP